MTEGKLRDSNSGNKINSVITRNIEWLDRAYLNVAVLWTFSAGMQALIGSSWVSLKVTSVVQEGVLLSAVQGEASSAASLLDLWIKLLVQASSQHISTCWCRNRRWLIKFYARLIIRTFWGKKGVGHSYKIVKKGQQKVSESVVIFWSAGCWFGLKKRKYRKGKLFKHVDKIM